MVTKYLKVLMTGGLEERPRDLIADGLAWKAKGDAKAAIADLTEGLKTDTRHLDGRLALARLLLAQRQLADAEAHARTAVGYHPTDVRTHVLLGEILQEQKQTAKAETCFRKAIQVDEKFTDAHIRLGVVLFEAGRLKEAMDVLNHAVFLDRKAAVARYYLAQICLDFEDYQRALAQLHFVDRIQPDFPPVIQTLATVFEHIGDTRQAIMEFNRLDDLGHADASIFFRLGLANLKLRAKDLALRAFERATDSEPRHWEAHYHAAQLLEEQKRWSQAIDHYRMLLNAKAYADLARLALARITRLLTEATQTCKGKAA